MARLHRAGALFLLAATACFAIRCGTRCPAAGAGGINITVRDANSKATICGAKVSVVGGALRQGCVYTQLDSCALFQTAAPGTYALDVSREGYFSRHVDAVEVVENRGECGGTLDAYVTVDLEPDPSEAEAGATASGTPCSD